MGANGGTPTQLTSGAGNNTEPAWSPTEIQFYLHPIEVVRHKFIEWMQAVVVQQ